MEERTKMLKIEKCTGYEQKTEEEKFVLKAKSK